MLFFLMTLLCSKIPSTLLKDFTQKSSHDVLIGGCRDSFDPYLGIHASCVFVFGTHLPLVPLYFVSYPTGKYLKNAGEGYWRLALLHIHKPFSRLWDLTHILQSKRSFHNLWYVHSKELWQSLKLCSCECVLRCTLSHTAPYGQLQP